MKIMISSVGSLVGQNLIDSLEFPKFPRRNLVEIVGTTSNPSAGASFRADRVHLIPETRLQGSSATFSRLVEAEKPDLVLFGRDADTLAFVDDLDALIPKPAFPAGSKASIEIAVDKKLSFQFAQNHSLPFARTFVPESSDIVAEAVQFAASAGLPIVAKPTRGNASRGVCFLTEMAQVESAILHPNYILQEFLGSPKEILDFSRDWVGAVPLQFQHEHQSHHTAHMYIDSKGCVSPVFVTENIHTAGATTRLRRVRNPGLVSIGHKFGVAFSEEGGRGHLGVQLREDSHGTWKAQEMNNRPNGNSFARLLMGQDDLFLAVADLLPSKEFPPVPRELFSEGSEVFKTLATNILADADVATLSGGLVWASSGTPA